MDAPAANPRRRSDEDEADEDSDDETAFAVVCDRCHTPLIVTSATTRAACPTCGAELDMADFPDEDEDVDEDCDRAACRRARRGR